MPVECNYDLRRERDSLRTRLAEVEAERDDDQARRAWAESEHASAMEHLGAAEARVQELEAVLANVHLSLGDDAILHDSDVIDRIMRITGYTRTTP